MYYNGEGVPKDYKEAVKWYRKAADQGIAHAQHNLAARGESRVESRARDLRWLARHQEETMPGHRR